MELEIFFIFIAFKFSFFFPEADYIQSNLTHGLVFYIEENVAFLEGRGIGPSGL